MNIPNFTAQASLYRTSRRYHSPGSQFSGFASTQSVVAAYHPGPTTQSHCNKCLQACAFDRDNCVSFVDTWVSWWNPLAPLLYARCYSNAADCFERCADPAVLGPCCPKVCGPLDPSNPGEGCCDFGDTCCDGKCCPPNLFCYDGGICDEPPSPGFPTAPPPPPPANKCSDFGLAPCGSHCCYAGLQCCGVDKFTGQPFCKESCIA